MRQSYKSTSPRTISELLVDDPTPNISREAGTITAAGTALSLVIGTALAFVSGAPVLFDPAGTDGSEVLAGLSLTSCEVSDGSSEDIKWIANGPARVNRDRIVWPDDITDEQIAAAEAVLIEAGIKIISGQGVKN